MPWPRPMSSICNIVARPGPSSMKRDITLVLEVVFCGLSLVDMGHKWATENIDSIWSSRSCLMVVSQCVVHDRLASLLPLAKRSAGLGLHGWWASVYASRWHEAKTHTRDVVDRHTINNTIAWGFCTSQFHMHGDDIKWTLCCMII